MTNLNSMDIWAASNRSSIPSSGLNKAVVGGDSGDRDTVVFAKWNTALDFLDIVVPFPST